MMQEKDELRTAHYNAIILDKQLINDHLAIFKIKCDKQNHAYQAGQFINIGLFNFEDPRLNVLRNEEYKLIKRPYSVSSPIIKSGSEFHDPIYADYFELYIALVDKGEFTPILFQKTKNERIYCSEKALGVYTMPEIKSSDTVIFASTGTGLAPHNSMLTDLLRKVHHGKIIIFDCVRYYSDLAYHSVIKQLQETYENLIYIPLTTREGMNKMYIQDFFSKDILENEYQVKLTANETHVFCCGNPAMIGIPKLNRETGLYEFPKPVGIVEIFMQKYGLSIYKAKSGGHIHFEKYW